MLVVLTLVGGAWLAFDRWEGRREWQQYREAALARGEKLTFREHASPSVPPEENYVTGTLFERVGAKYSVGAEPERAFKLPAPKSLNPKATLAERLEGTKAAMLEAGWLKREKLPLETARAVLLGLERFQTELDELRAARSRPRSHFPQSELPPPKTEFRSVLLAMDVAAVLALRIDAYLAAGEPVGALESLRDGVRLYRAMIGEPTMLAGLGRQTVLSLLIRSVDHGLAGQLWGDEELRQIEILLGSIDVAADARRAFSSERGFINDAAESEQRLPPRVQVAQVKAVDFAEQMPRGWRLWLTLVSGDSWRRWTRQNRVLDHRLAQFSAGVDGVFENSPPGEVANEIQLTSVTDMIGKRYVTIEMALRQARLVCVLERFRIARGAYPSTLAELVPEFISAIPRDAIDIHPLRYRRIEPDKFLLYSVGANGRDDSGSAILDKGTAGAFKALDWVWGEPWK